VDVFGILANVVYAVAGLAFLSGLLITAIAGAAKPVKTFLWILSGIFTVLIVIGFIFTRGLLIFLFFQIVALILIWYLFVVVGAVCGGGLYSLRHKQAPGKRLTQAELGDYLPAAEFAAREGIEVERALARIRSSYYRGGQYEGAWYIHKTEQANQVSESN
jgi:hypothetical protein